MEAFEEQMSFMKSLTRFISTRTVVEHLKDLSAHTLSVTINAAYLLFRFSSVNLYSDDCKKLQSEMLVLLQMIRPTDFRVYGVYTQALSCSKVQNRLLEDGGVKEFLDSLKSNMWDLLRLSSCSASVKHLQELYEGLRSLRTILKEKQHLEINKDIGDFLCDAAVFICSLHHTQRKDLDLALKNLLDTGRNVLVQIKVAKEAQFIQTIKKEDDSTGYEEEEETGVKEVTVTYRARMTSQGEGSTSRTSEKVEVGLHDVQRLIVDQLTWGLQKLQIIAIVGMPGLGKTTLATRLYTHPSVLHHFAVRAWTLVSQAVDKRKVVLDLFNQIDPIKCSEVSSDPDVAADKLRKSFKGRRYLLFLDDMWDAAAWDILKELFPDDNVGSRIILTSRQHDVAPHDLMVDRKPHSLRQLNQQESIELLQSELSSGLSLDIGMKIAEKCQGLPLMIVIVAGVLKTTDPEGWNTILDGFRSVSSKDILCRNTLELSYQHLPAHLRPCFLNFGTFVEDAEISARRLSRLWIAEGFVQNAAAAEGYLNDLIGRSLTVVVKQRSSGGVKTCRIHDLLHEFCIQKAKDEHFFHFLKGYDELSSFNEQQSLCRLCIHSEVQHFKQSKLFCPRAGSLIFTCSQSQSTQNRSDERMPWVDISSAIRIFRLLTVLDLEQVSLGERFPTEIEELVWLVFLAIQCDKDIIPSLIGNLSNLQTFIMQYGGFYPVLFPDSLWNLQKLQYLHINSGLFREYGSEGGGCLPKNNDETSCNLPSLERLSGFIIPPSKMECLLSKFPNIRKLKFILPYRSHFVVPDTLSRLESLHIVCRSKLSAATSPCPQFCVPTHLKKLTLRNFSLSWRNLSTIGALPNLEVLKLVSTELEEEIWEMKEGEFSNLKILKLADLKLVRWFTDCDDQLDCLEKLILEDCSCLVEMPSVLDYIPTLAVIDVSGCAYEVVELVRQIEETRKELMGDSGVKIVTHHTSRSRWWW